MALIAGRFPETSTPAAGAGEDGDDRARVESDAHAHDDGNTNAHDDVEGNKMVGLRVRGGVFFLLLLVVEFTAAGRQSRGPSLLMTRHGLAGEFRLRGFDWRESMAKRSGDLVVAVVMVERNMRTLPLGKRDLL